MPKKAPAKPKAGRQIEHPEGRQIPLPVGVPEKLVAKLDKWRDSRGLNRSQAVTEAIRRLVG